MKVLYVQQPAGGGSLLGLYELLKQLDKTVVETVVLCYYKNRYTTILEKIPHVKVYYVEDERLIIPLRIPCYKSKLLNIFSLQINAALKYFFYDRHLIAFIKSIIDKEKPDIVHHFTDIISNREAIRATVPYKIPQIIFYHSLAGYGRNYFDYIMDRLLIKKIRFHIHMTEAVKIHFSGLFGLTDDVSAVINDFVDTGKFTPESPDCLKASEFGICKDDFVFSNIGRITEWKGQHVLIEAANILKEQFDNFKVLIVGPYDKGVGSETYYHYLRSLTEKYMLQDKIIFTGNRDDIADIINLSDVIVHTSVKPEPQGIVIMESMLCHKPVIATNAGGAVELIKKYGGLLVQPGDIAGLKNIMSDFLKKAKNNGLPDYGFPCDYERLNMDFNSGKQIEQMMKIYRNVIQ